MGFEFLGEGGWSTWERGVGVLRKYLGDGGWRTGVLGSNTSEWAVGVSGSGVMVPEREPAERPKQAEALLEQAERKVNNKKNG